jgi:glycosyltransferase involved in cell wall biosynthesis
LSAQTPAALSIISTAYNEDDSIEELCCQIHEVCRREKYDYEIILVDDGSTDSTSDKILHLAAESDTVKPVLLQRNFGQTAALSAGIDRAQFPLIVTLDADLQNDPGDIPVLLSVLTDSIDVVSGWRKQRQDTFFSRRLPSWFANLLIGRITGVRLHDYGCSLKLYRASILKNVRLYGELHRFIPALCAAVGGRVTEVPVRHHPRTAGHTKYGISRTFRVVVDLITVKFLLSYGTRPMHFFGMAAMLCFLAGSTSGVFTLIMKFSLTPISINRNPLFYLTVLMGIAGVQFLAVGLLAELVMRTYFEAQNKPVYVLRIPPGTRRS